MRSCRLATLGMVLALAGHACATGRTPAHPKPGFDRALRPKPPYAPPLNPNPPTAPGPRPSSRPAIRQVTPSFGFPGQKILLSGENFGAFPRTVTVRLAGESYGCDVVSWSGRQVVARLPAKLDEVLGKTESAASLTVHALRGPAAAQFRVVGRALLPAIRGLSSPTIRPGERLTIMGGGFLAPRRGKVWFVRPVGKRRRTREARVQQWTESRIAVTLGRDFDDAPRGVWQVRVANWRGYQAEADITFVPPGRADAEPAVPPAAKAPPAKAPATKVATLELHPAAATVHAGDKVQFTVIARGADGREAPVPVVVWDVTGGALLADGVYRAGQGVGTFVVIALDPVSGLRAVAEVEIKPKAPGAGRDGRDHKK
ncbi:IPT/TIG domain-containing protein [bacterium]|nr:IPT/TIG domain-containing protein [bacterium]